MTVEAKVGRRICHLIGLHHIPDGVYLDHGKGLAWEHPATGRFLMGAVISWAYTVWDEDDPLDLIGPSMRAFPWKQGGPEELVETLLSANQRNVPEWFCNEMVGWADLVGWTGPEVTR
jgi:hypothetical protein